jgi:hypothetical protein
MEFAKNNNSIPVGFPNCWIVSCFHPPADHRTRTKKSVFLLAKDTMSFHWFSSEITPRNSGRNPPCRVLAGFGNFGFLLPLLLFFRRRSALLLLLRRRCSPVLSGTTWSHSYNKGKLWAKKFQLSCFLQKIGNTDASQNCNGQNDDKLWDFGRCPNLTRPDHIVPSRNCALQNEKECFSVG